VVECRRGPTLVRRCCVGDTPVRGSRGTIDAASAPKLDARRARGPWQPARTSNLRAADGKFRQRAARARMVAGLGDCPFRVCRSTFRSPPCPHSPLRAALRPADRPINCPMQRVWRGLSRGPSMVRTMGRSLARSVTQDWPLHGALNSPTKSVQGKGLCHIGGALTRTLRARLAPSCDPRPWRSAWLRHFSRSGATPPRSGLRPDTHAMRSAGRRAASAGPPVARSRAAFTHRLSGAAAGLAAVLQSGLRRHHRLIRGELVYEIDEVDDWLSRLRRTHRLRDWRSAPARARAQNNGDGKSSTSSTSPITRDLFGQARWRRRGARG
jgi:hypothetical protein